MDDLRGFLTFLTVTLFTGAFIIFIILTPLFYLDGKAKSIYLREYKGLEFSWYEATFLPDEIFINADINVETIERN